MKLTTENPEMITGILCVPCENLVSGNRYAIRMRDDGQQFEEAPSPIHATTNYVRLPRVIRHERIPRLRCVAAGQGMVILSSSIRPLCPRTLVAMASSGLKLPRRRK